MQQRDVIVVGASAGGVEALQLMVDDLPEDLPASIFIVLHVPAQAPSALPAILERKSKLPVLAASDKLIFQPGHIYVAQPDHHLLIEPGQMRVIRGPRENRHRPAIDPLFRSAAWACGPRVIGVVLTGTMDDGTAGLWAVKTCGGTTVVQNPDDAMYPCMPRNALDHVDIDHCLPLEDIPLLLSKLARTPIGPVTSLAVPEKIKIESEAAMLERSIEDMEKIGIPSVFTCPACKGSLWEIEEGNLTRYRCHIGHSYQPGSLVVDQSENILSALYSALAAIEEKAAMLRRIGEKLEDTFPNERERYDKLAEEQDEQAEQLRKLIRG